MVSAISSGKWAMARSRSRSIETACRLLSMHVWVTQLAAGRGSCCQPSPAIHASRAASFTLMASSPTVSAGRLRTICHS